MKRLPAALAAALLATSLPAFADSALRAEALRLFGSVPAPSAAAVGSSEAQLGRALFWDPRVSLDGKTACASCHLDHGADRRAASIDAKGLPTSRHSPTVFNSMGQPTIRWLGDRKHGADQAEGSITGSLGFASKQAALEKLKELRYDDQFRAAYPDEDQPLTA
ncbi:MAG TPA: cytochrome-c peroxidase, partial [Usitatibacter sp.]|nr:cytochrome-c peroxidase [Usitatibacter sp.]